MTVTERNEAGEDTGGCREHEEERENRAESHEAGLLSTCRCRKCSYPDAKGEALEELVERYRWYESFKVGTSGECEGKADDE